MQREGDGGGGVDGRDVDAKNRLSGGRLRPMQRRRRWFLAVLGAFVFVSQQELASVLQRR